MNNEPKHSERRIANAAFNGCLKDKRGEYCLPCVAQATNYTYSGEDRRKTSHDYAASRASKPEGVDEKWYGYAGHLIGGKQCAYHLCTRVGGHLISTVGHYLPVSKGGEVMETIGAGKDAFFETYVFRCDGDDENGDPNIIDWGEIDGKRYAKSIDAENGHYEFLAKYRASLAHPAPQDVGEK